MGQPTTAITRGVTLLVALLALSLLPLRGATSAGGWKTFPAAGGAAVLPVPADYDGDGLTDLGVYDPTTGEWRAILGADGYTGAPQPVALGLTRPTAQPVPADYDGDLRDDPAVVYFNGEHWTLAVQPSRSGLIGYYPFGGGQPAFRALAADVDGDGAADPLVYAPRTGVVYGLLSSRRFSNSPEDAFLLGAGVLDGQPFVVDYDNGRPGINDRTAPAYPRGRDLRDDLAILAPSGVVHLFTSHYGLYNHTAWLTGFAQRGDTPVQGDFDGDGLKDVAVYRRGPEGGQFRALLSSQAFALDALKVETLGSPDAADDDRPTPGQYDLDGRTDVAVYRHAGPGAGQWHARFSEDGLNTPPTTYPSPRFGLGMANWDDAAKTCYESELGVEDTAEDEDTYAPGQPIPCDADMYHEANGVSESAQRFTRDGKVYRLHPLALNVSWGNTLDPRANAPLVMFKYRAATGGLTDRQRAAYLAYAHDIPGAIQVEFDLTRCNPGPYGKCQDPDGGRRLVYTDGSAIWQRAAFRQWLIANRQGPHHDPRRWYMFLVGAEMDGYAWTSAATYTRILRDYTRFLAEVRGAIQAEYGLTVKPTIVLSSPAMGCNYDVPTMTTLCDHRPHFLGAPESQWPATQAYYTSVLQRLTRPGAVDLDGDGAATAPYEDWTQADADNFNQFFQFTSLDPFFNHPLGSDSLIGQPGQPSVAHLDDFAAEYAERLRGIAQSFYDLPGCWNAKTQRYEACRRPLLLQQMGTRYYGVQGQGWLGAGCPTQPPGRVCDDNDLYPFDDIRYNTLYVTARLTQTLVRELARDPGHVAAWAYWVSIDGPEALDPVQRRVWGSLGASVEPVLDFDPVCEAGGCRKDNVRFTPLGEVYLAAATGDTAFRPGPFTYVGNRDTFSGSIRRAFSLPGWWRRE